MSDKLFSLSLSLAGGNSIEMQASDKLKFVGQDFAVAKLGAPYGHSDEKN
jgi:hypothetical protein